MSDGLPASQHHAIGFRESAQHLVYGAIWRATIGGALLILLDHALS